MDDDKLNSFQQNELKWLQYSRRLNIERELWSAKEELSTFVKNLRKAGKKI
jgi:hypothetical protein